MTREDIKNLIAWYQVAHRPLPWRKTQDPYAIWISEVMLQQTTTKAVLPYYERFLQTLPTVQVLAKSKIEVIYELWAGLGYYSRARNLHKASKEIVALGGFPKTALELQKLPGFGPYTSRAVSSFAFQESVGVLDGNVIRVLCRKNNLKIKWWSTKERQTLQELADQVAQIGPAQLINQALMELGATICTPQSPACIQCPFLKSCTARVKHTVTQVPLAKPRRSKDIWIWQPTLETKNNSVYLEPNDYAPFLKNSWLPRGLAKKVNDRPMRYDFCHTITHHEIYVQVRKKRDTLISRSKTPKQGRWVSKSQLSRVAPSSLVRKAVSYAFENKK